MGQFKGRLQQSSQYQQHTQKGQYLRALNRLYTMTMMIPLGYSTRVRASGAQSPALGSASASRAIAPTIRARFTYGTLLGHGSGLQVWGVGVRRARGASTTLFCWRAFRQSTKHARIILFGYGYISFAPLLRGVDSVHELYLYAVFRFSGRVFRMGVWKSGDGVMENGLWMFVMCNLIFECWKFVR